MTASRWWYCQQDGKKNQIGQRSCEKVMASFLPSAQKLLAETAFFLTETMASARDDERVRFGGAGPKTTTHTMGGFAR